jgi:hypothetical protein
MEQRKVYETEGPTAQSWGLLKVLTTVLLKVTWTVALSEPWRVEPKAGQTSKAFQKA